MSGCGEEISRHGAIREVGREIQALIRLLESRQRNEMNWKGC